MALTHAGQLNALPDFTSLDESATDKVDRELARRKRVAAMAEIRLSIREQAALAWWDQIDDVLGPKPDTAEGWADRGLQVLQLGLVDGIGINPKACAAYAAECRANASRLDPTYGPKMNVQVDVTVTALSQRLQEGRARVIEQLPATPANALSHNRPLREADTEQPVSPDSDQDHGI